LHPWPEPAAAEPLIHALPRGARLLLLPQPQARVATAALFVGSGSAHERPHQAGISHVVEHMVFKGTARRDARRINLDAERLGAEVNAHTDKDHTAYHLRGLPQDLPAFIELLAELVLEPTFPADELERERQVLLQEHAEDADDPVSTGFKLFDRACFGTQPVAHAVIGPRRHVERFTRDELAAFVRNRYTAPNLVLALAGPLQGPLAPQALLRRAEDALAAAPAGTRHALPPPLYGGGLATRRSDAGSQVHLVLGGGLPPLARHDAAATVAAAVLGEGMSSPLLLTLRERAGLAYHAAASADVLGVCGQFVVEASTEPARFGRLLSEVLTLLRRHAQHVPAEELERAQRQLQVRELQAQERPLRRLEDAALDLLHLGRVRSAEERIATLLAPGTEAVRDAFQRLLAAGLSVAVTGDVPRGTRAQLQQALAA
jgi:predicted Zn-dependent peptidase